LIVVKQDGSGHLTWNKTKMASSWFDVNQDEKSSCLELDR